MEEILSYIIGPAKSKTYALWIYNNKREVLEAVILLVIILIGIESYLIMR